MIKQAIIFPGLFGIMMLIYHLTGEHWDYSFQQIYAKGVQFGFIISLLWITGYYMPRTIRKAYRYGYSSYFLFIFMYKFLMSLGITVFNEKWNHAFWVALAIIFILFSVYLLTKKEPIKTCKN